MLDMKTKVTQWSYKNQILVLLGVIYERQQTPHFHTFWSQFTQETVNLFLASRRLYDPILEVSRAIKICCTLIVAGKKKVSFERKAALFVV